MVPSAVLPNGILLRAQLPPSLRLNCFAPDLDYIAMTPEQIAADLRGQLAARSLHRLVIVGHGLGCAIALRLRALADDIALVAPPLCPDGGLIPTHPQTGELWIDGLAHRPDQVDHFHFHRMIAMQQLSALLSDSADPAILARLRAEGAALRADPAMRDGDIRILTGAEDRTAQASDWREHAPDAKIDTLPDAGHMAHLEVPQILAPHLVGLHGAVSPLTRTVAEVSLVS